MTTFAFMFCYATQWPRVKFQTYQPCTHSPAALTNATAAVPNARTHIGGMRNRRRKFKSASTNKAKALNS
jgi:hypothetical protein